MQIAKTQENKEAAKNKHTACKRCEMACVGPGILSELVPRVLARPIKKKNSEKEQILVFWLNIIYFTPPPSFSPEYLYSFRFAQRCWFIFLNAPTPALRLSKMKLPKWGPICWMILSRRVHVQKPARYTPKALSTSSWPIWSLFICLIYCLTFIFFSRSSLALSSSSVPLHAPEFSYQYLSPKTNYVMFMFVPSFWDGRYRKKKQKTGHF